MKRFAMFSIALVVAFMFGTVGSAEAGRRCGNGFGSRGYGTYPVYPGYGGYYQPNRVYYHPGHGGGYGGYYQQPYGGYGYGRDCRSRRGRTGRRILMGVGGALLLRQLFR